MNLLEIVGWGGNQTQTPTAELPFLFPFPFPFNEFVKSDVVNIYTRILTDVLERTEGLKEDFESLLWDNCLGSENPEGLVTLIAKAMHDKSQLFLKYDKSLKVVRKATSDEQSQITADYKARGESKAGVFLTFDKYTRTDFVKLYSGLEYCTVASLHKSMNLSKAIQMKFKDLRASTGLNDSADVSKQAVELAQHLSKGRDIALDAGDSIDTAKPDLTATKSSMEFIANKQSFYLGLPASYIVGLQSTSSMSDTGKADSKAVERGLRAYYFSIVKPVLEALFDAKTTFKSEDFEMLTTATETLTTFEATSDELISQDNKRKLLNKLFGLPANAKGDKPEVIEPPAAIIPGQDPKAALPGAKPQAVPPFQGKPAAV